MIGWLLRAIGASQTSRAATIMLALTLTASNVLGVVRDHYLAQKIPTSLLDTYYAAFRIPDLLFNLLLLGAITSAFLPVFVGAWNKGKGAQRAWEIAQTMTTISAIFTVTLAVFLFILAPVLIPLVVPSFDAERMEIVVKLTRIMLLSPLFFGFSYIFGTVLNAFKQFVAYSFAPLIYNGAIIFATLMFADRYGVYAVTWGVVAGAALHMLIQLPSVLRLGFRWKLIFSTRDPAVRRIGSLMIPRVLALGSQQLALTAFTVIGSAMTAGSIAIYNLTNNIQTAPVVILGTSFATAYFARMAELASANEKNKLGELIEQLVRVIAFLLIPASIGLFILRAQVVRLILGSGHFTWTQTISAIDTLAWFIPGIVAQGLMPVFARAFYSIHDTRTPMIITVVSFTLMVGVSLAGTLMGAEVPVLALAFSLGSIVNAAWMLIVLSRRLPSLSLARILGSSTLIAFISAGMGFAMWLALRIANGTGIQIFSQQVVPGVGLDTHTGIGLLIQALFASLVGMAVYYVLTQGFNVKEWQWLKTRKISSKI